MKESYLAKWKLLEDVFNRYDASTILPNYMNKDSTDPLNTSDIIAYSIPYLKEAHDILDQGPKYPDKVILPLPEYAEFYFRSGNSLDKGFMHRASFAAQEIVAGALKNIYLYTLDMQKNNYDGRTNKRRTNKHEGFGELLSFFGQFNDIIEKGIFLCKYSKTYYNSRLSTEKFFEKYTPKIKELGLERLVASKAKEFVQEYAPKLVIYDVSEKINNNERVEFSFKAKIQK